MAYKQSSINLIAFSINVALGLCLVILLPTQKLDCNGTYPGQFRDTKFGVDKFNARMVDGAFFKFVASLQWKGRHFCTAIIVGKHWALTSSKCIEQYHDNLFIAPDTTPQFIYPVNQTEIFEHIAFVYVKKKFQSAHFTPVAIASTPNSPRSALIMQLLPKLVLGWGRRDNKYHRIHGTEMYVINPVKCEFLYRGKRMVNVSGQFLEYYLPTVEKGSKTFCAGMNKRTFSDTCDKDLGSPMIQGDNLIGFVSSHYKCWKSGFPGVYVNLTDREILRRLKEIDLFYGIGISFQE